MIIIVVHCVPSHPHHLADVARPLRLQLMGCGPVVTTTTSKSPLTTWVSVDTSFACGELAASHRLRPLAATDVLALGGFLAAGLPAFFAGASFAAAGWPPDSFCNAGSNAVV